MNTKYYEIKKLHGFFVFKDLRGKFCIVLLGHFIKHKHLISEEYWTHNWRDICFFDDDNGLVENLLILQDYKVVWS